MEKRKKKGLREGFYIEIAKLAHPERLRITEQQATEMKRRILNSFASRPDGAELADSFVAVVSYFAGIGYWRGYKNARKHYATIQSISRPPRGSKNVRLAIEKILEKQRNLSTKEVCDILDREGLSESFEPKKRRQRYLNVGPRRGGKVEHSWASVYSDDCVKRMISRIRSRLRKQRTAEAWIRLAEQALVTRGS